MCLIYVTLVNTYFNFTADTMFNLGALLSSSYPGEITWLDIHFEKCHNSKARLLIIMYPSMYHSHSHILVTLDNTVTHFQ